MTAEHSTLVAIAKAGTAAAERLPAAIIDLVIETAVIGAIRTSTDDVRGAMIAKARRQRLRLLPVDPHQRT